LARLMAMENHIPMAPSALLRRASCCLAGRQLQHRLDGGAASYIDQFVASQTALLDQIHHGQKDLPAPGQIPGQLLLVHFSLLAYRVVAFLHGGSPFKVWQPDSFRIRLNRRSTFNYGWDILIIFSWPMCDAIQRRTRLQGKALAAKVRIISLNSCNIV